MNIISRAEAKALGLKRYFTGKPCKNGHISEWQVASYQCCECSRIKNSEKYHANPEKLLAQQKEYRANNAEKVREQAKANRLKNRDALLAGKKAYYERVKLDPEWQKREAEKRLANREKKREYDKQYAVLNSAKKVEAANVWRKENPDRRKAIVFAYDGRRRTQKEQGDSTAEIREWIKAVKKVCYWCGDKCANDYHIDHYQPLSKGGEHRVSNLVIACPTCNLRKNAKDPLEFAASMGRLF